MKTLLFKRAWKLYRENKGSLFSECLKESWNEYKLNKGEETMKTFKIKDWFYEKELSSYEFDMEGKRRENNKKYGCNYCCYKMTFTSENIIKETEKALLINPQPEFEVKEEEKEEISKRQIWIPKSLVEEIKSDFEYFQKLEGTAITNCKNIQTCYEIYKLKQCSIIEKADTNRYFKATNKENENEYIYFYTYKDELLEV